MNMASKVWIPIHADTEKVEKNINSWMEVTKEYPYIHKIQDRINSLYPTWGTQKILCTVEINNGVIKIPPLMVDKKLCSICMEEDIGCFETLKCNHEFHLRCINKWFKSHNTCPLCRTVIHYILLPD